MINLQNIHNYKRTVYLFIRNDDGTLTIQKDNTFYPYFYEKSDTGEYDTYDGHKATKIVCGDPSDIKDKKTINSYESDIPITKRYILDKIDGFNKSPTKIFYIDIEILTEDFPSPEEANKPVSCVTIYNTGKEEYKTWFLGDYKKKSGASLECLEQEMLEDFVLYMQREQPDILVGWNIENFDYVYLNNRIKNFAKQISPINMARYVYGYENVFYPAGISIVDYMKIFKRVHMREQSYSLDRICRKYLKEQAWEETDFNTLDDIVKEKNINDVRRMVDLEKKEGILNLYDGRRRFTTCLWEDLFYNSKVLDMFLLREAKRRKLVLPTKNRDEEVGDLEGAYRRADVGVYHDIWKADVGSMYPNQIVNFCLDLQNIRKEPEEDTIEIEGVYFKQNSNALLPFVASQLIGMKNTIKEDLKELNPDTQEHKDLQAKYDAVKALVNSLYGICALPSFRLYNFTIASTITYLSREVLKYVENRMNEEGHTVYYTDTDSLFYKAEKDETEFLNKLVIDWSVMNFNKMETTIAFENEAKFEDLLILGKCHYYGKKEGAEIPEIKGIEIKRSSSSKYEAYYQEELIKHILKGKSKEEVVKWIESEKERIKTLPIIDISFPCKIANKKYKNEPIFVRAYNNSRRFNENFKLNKGELFFYIFVNKLGTDGKGKNIDVIGITEDMQFSNIKEHIDWRSVIERTVVKKTASIFDALQWGDMDGRETLF